MPALEPPRLGGRYEILDRFAVGGAAEIFRAKDAKNGHVVVVKRMRPDLPFDPEVSAGFLREIQLSLLCKHKNVLRGLDHGSHSGLDYVVLEYIRGKDLEMVIDAAQRRGLRISHVISIHIVQQMLAGLSAIHTLQDHDGMPMGLVHRDLTPRNVFVRYDGEVRVADFGASVATAQEPVPDEVVGSVGYLSPEQAALQVLDGRTDIFCCGLILFELLLGQPAFPTSGRKESQILRLHQKGAIKKLPRGMPDDLKMIIDIACSPDPEDRYANAHTMYKSLQEALDDRGGFEEAIGGLKSLMSVLYQKEMQKEMPELS
ncbi:MAG: serine/threonine protein kinase [Deltaproteobacteria bacterium]|nr:serine/threonine protein kinase [Deltaproteobacteria bacterium]